MPGCVFFVNWMTYISLFLGVQNCAYIYIYTHSLILTIGSIFFGMLEFQICQLTKNGEIYYMYRRCTYTNGHVEIYFKRIGFQSHLCGR